jgi:hypothetical protein
MKGTKNPGQKARQAYETRKNTPNYQETKEGEKKRHRADQQASANGEEKRKKIVNSHHRHKGMSAIKPSEKQN